MSASGAARVNTQAAVTSLTDNSGGTASDTIPDPTALYNETTIANALASLTAKVNTLITRLVDAKVLSE